MTCQAEIFLMGNFTGSCGAPSAGRYRTGCIHEHVVVCDLCRHHAGTTGIGRCGACWWMGHDCPIGAERADAGQD